MPGICGGHRYGTEFICRVTTATDLIRANAGRPSAQVNITEELSRIRELSGTAEAQQRLITQMLESYARGMHRDRRLGEVEFGPVVDEE